MSLDPAPEMTVRDRINRIRLNFYHVMFFSPAELGLWSTTAATSPAP